MYVLFLPIRDNTHAFYASVFHRQLMVTRVLLCACILYTLAFCASIFHRQSMKIHMFLMHVFLYTLTFCASIFHR